jgi:hypothetical protein
VLSLADYGNEKECGEGVARAIKEGLVKREELFIVSKLWNSFHDGERVEPICKKQLADWYVSRESPPPPPPHTPSLFPKVALAGVSRRHQESSMPRV